MNQENPNVEDFQFLKLDGSSFPKPFLSNSINGI
jgi:hypothetical protein